MTEIFINLLPKKERTRDYPKLISLSFVLVGIVVSASFAGLTYMKNGELAQGEQELQQVVKLRETLEANATAFSNSSSFETLSTTINWAQTYPVVSSEVLAHIISLLPERGYFVDYEYTEAGTIGIDVRFDSSREVAFFLDRLLASPSIKSAVLSGISTQELSEETEDVLPRYVGSFSIELQDGAFSNQEKEEEQP